MGLLFSPVVANLYIEHFEAAAHHYRCRLLSYWN